jgi:aspartate racemase
MSWESTAEYYRLLNEGISRRLGGLHSAECVLYSLDFAPIEELQRRGDWTRLGDLLANAARTVEAAGARILLLCTNTMHKCAPAIEAAVEVPFLHIADVTARAVQASGLSVVTLLGTRFTMDERFYINRLARSCNAEIRVPPEPARREVDRLIFQELCLGQVRPQAVQWMLRLLESEREAGSQGVILGCTELPMVVPEGDTPIPVFDTTRLHAEAALETATRGC